MKKLCTIILILVTMHSLAQYDSQHLNKLDSANKERSKEIRRVTLYGTVVVACTFSGIPAYPVLALAAIDLASIKRNKRKKS